MHNILKSIFITKDLLDTHPIKVWCKGQNIECFAYSLLRFSKIEIDHIPTAEWLFFYSQKGVDFLLEQISIKDLKTFKIACFGPATAAHFIRKTHQDVTFNGTGFPKENAALFAPLICNEKVIFVRAENSLMSVQKLLPAEINQIDMVVYKSEIDTIKSIPHSDISVLTSPLNAQAYFNQYKKVPSKKIIALGQTTKVLITNQYGKTVETPDKPNLASVLNLLKSKIQ